MIGISALRYVDRKATCIIRTCESENFRHHKCVFSSFLFLYLISTQGTDLHVSDIKLELPAGWIWLDEVVEYLNTSFGTDRYHLQVTELLWNLPVWLLTLKYLKHIVGDNWSVLIHGNYRLSLIWRCQTYISDTENVLHS